VYKSADSNRNSNGNSNGHAQLDEESGTVYSSGSSSGDAVRIVQLRKVYPGGKEAVRQLSLGIPRYGHYNPCYFKQCVLGLTLVHMK
jgi:hypothetical protein